MVNIEVIMVPRVFKNNQRLLYYNMLPGLEEPEMGHRGKTLLVH